MDYDDYEQLIKKRLKEYQNHKGKAQAKRDLFKTLNSDIDSYRMFLDEQSASIQKYDWLHAQIKKMYEVKNKAQVQAGQQVQIEAVFALGQDISSRLNIVQGDVDQAVEYSAMIQKQLNAQIEHLDAVFEENIKGQKRLERAKKGLIAILRRAMFNRCTRLLMVLLVLVVIGLIVVIVLKDNGIIVTS